MELATLALNFSLLPALPPRVLVLLLPHHHHGRFRSQREYDFRLLGSWNGSPLALGRAREVITCGAYGPRDRSAGQERGETRIAQLGHGRPRPA